MKSSFMDIVPSAERQLTAEVRAWVQSAIEPDTELAVLFREKAIFPFMVVTYRNKFDTFPHRRSFKTWTEAWIHFTAFAELNHFKKEGPNDAVT